MTAQKRTESSDIAGRLRAFFSDKEEVVLAFLFGSHARPDVTRHGDVDVAVWLADGYTFKKVKALWDGLERVTHSDVDLILLNEAGPCISWTAVRGVPLLIRNDKFHLEYLLRVSSEAEEEREFFSDLFRWREIARREAHAAAAG